MSDEQFKKLTDILEWGLLWMFLMALNSCLDHPHSNAGIERQIKRIADHLEAEESHK